LTATRHRNVTGASPANTASFRLIPPIVDQLRAALDAHDLDAYIDLFHEDFVGERSRHPGAEVRRDEVCESWGRVSRRRPRPAGRGVAKQPVEANA
jgi:hypothetical protein